MEDFQIGDLVYRPPDMTTFAIEKKVGIIVGINVDDVGYEYLTIRWNDGFRMEASVDETKDSIKHGYWVHYPVKK